MGWIPCFGSSCKKECIFDSWWFVDSKYLIWQVTRTLFIQTPSSFCKTNIQPKPPCKHVINKDQWINCTQFHRVKKYQRTWNHILSKPQMPSVFFSVFRRGRMGSSTISFVFGCPCNILPKPMFVYPNDSVKKHHKLWMWSILDPILHQIYHLPTLVFSRKSQYFPVWCLEHSHRVLFLFDTFLETLDRLWHGVSLVIAAAATVVVVFWGFGAWKGLWRVEGFEDWNIFKFY